MKWKKIIKLLMIVGVVTTASASTPPNSNDLHNAIVTRQELREMIINGEDVTKVNLNSAWYQIDFF